MAPSRWRRRSRSSRWPLLTMSKRTGCGRSSSMNSKKRGCVVGSPYPASTTRKISSGARRASAWRQVARLIDCGRSMASRGRIAHAALHLLVQLDVGGDAVGNVHAGAPHDSAAAGRSAGMWRAQLGTTSSTSTTTARSCPGRSAVRRLALEQRRPAIDAQPRAVAEVDEQTTDLRVLLQVAQAHERAVAVEIRKGEAARVEDAHQTGATALEGTIATPRRIAGGEKEERCRRDPRLHPVREVIPHSNRSRRAASQSVEVPQRRCRARSPAWKSSFDGIFRPRSPGSRRTIGDGRRAAPHPAHALPTRSACSGKGAVLSEA